MLEQSSAKFERECPACGKSYSPDYVDTFCTCGTELRAARREAGVAPKRLPTGTHCLVLYGANREPLHSFPLDKDVVQIGRQDPVAGCFPDIDVGVWLDETAARRVSRQHALILRSRRDGAYYLRPLAGNTGTQLDADMVPALNDYLLKPGTRLILGGAVRLKYEIT